MCANETPGDHLSDPRPKRRRLVSSCNGGDSRFSRVSRLLSGPSASTRRRGNAGLAHVTLVDVDELHARRTVGFIVGGTVRVAF